MPYKVQESSVPGFMGADGEIRINLNEDDFKVLVSGGELLKIARGHNASERNVRIILSEIGYSRMIQAIRGAMRNLIP
jgi:hypothetical protein